MKVGVVLSGCGLFDGTEIHEAVLILLALSKHGVQYEGIAPNRSQHHVVDHSTQLESKGPRNILSESARIMRGNVKALSDADVLDYDAIIFPGGFGAAKNLSNFALKEDSTYTVSDDILTFIQNAISAGKPLGFACVSPILIPHAFPKGVKLTIGNDPSIISAIESNGGDHVETEFDEIVVDHENKVVSTPAYMLGQSISDVQIGIDRLVEAVLHMV
jgi:enhancing lycopene biosynthesis protein 2